MKEFEVWSFLFLGFFSFCWFLFVECCIVEFFVCIRVLILLLFVYNFFFVGLCFKWLLYFRIVWFLVGWVLWVGSRLWRLMGKWWESDGVLMMKKCSLRSLNIGFCGGGWLRGGSIELWGFVGWERSEVWCEKFLFIWGDL